MKYPGSVLGRVIEHARNSPYSWIRRAQDLPVTPLPTDGYAKESEVYEYQRKGIDREWIIAAILFLIVLIAYLVFGKPT